MEKGRALDFNHVLLGLGLSHTKKEREINKFFIYSSIFPEIKFTQVHLKHIS